MSGDIDNAGSWPDADVYIAPVGTANPATVDTAFGVAWDQVGLLDGDAGFVFSRDEEKNEFYAWGGALVRVTRRNFKQTISFVALEDNDTTLQLIWPGSTADELVVPRPAEVKIAFELREGVKVKRYISRLHAEVEINGEITESEADLTRYELLATIFPDTAATPYVLFDVQKTAAGS